MIPSIYAQTGWIGALPETVCQDFSVLVKVYAYNYDLDDTGFIEYCKNRGSWNKVPFEGAAYEFFEDCTLEKLDFLLTQESRVSMHGYKFSENELDAMWSIILAGRGALQDSWEVYTGRRV